MDNSNTGKGYYDYMIVSSEMKDALSELVGTPNDDESKKTARRILEEKMIELEKRYTTKTDGDGNVMIVDNPDYVSEDGSFRKHRKKNTGYTPPKKKRKKNKKTHR